MAIGVGGREGVGGQEMGLLLYIHACIQYNTYYPFFFFAVFEAGQGKERGGASRPAESI